MKWLTKLRLINWHYFTDETIYFDKQTVISGKNTAGKSTILDAMQVLFIANMQTAKFNSAAHDDAKRSLMSYLRGKTGNEDQQYLRNGDFSTYIMAEFHDDVSQECFVIGYVSDIYTADIQEHSKYFILGNCLIEEVMVVDDDGILRNQAALDEYLKTGWDSNYVSYPNKSQYQQAFRHRMGQVGERFFTTYTKALSFKPIRNIRDFVNDYILEEQPLNIEIMRENFTAHQSYKLELASLAERRNKLIEIKDEDRQYQQFKETVHQQDFVVRKLDVEAQNQVVASMESKIIELEGTLEITLEIIKMHEEQKAKAEKELDEAKRQYYKNKDRNSMEQLKKERESATEEQSEAEKIFNLLTQHLSNQIMTIDHWFKVESNRYWEWDENHLEDLKTGRNLLNLLLTKLQEGPLQDPMAEQEQMKSLAGTISTLYEKLAGKLNRVEGEKKDHQTEIRSLQEEIKNLQKKKVSYSASVSMLKELLESRLEGKSEVWIFCEQMEVEDESWRDAIEGYLGTQRFELLVGPQYFEEALSIYETEKKHLKIEGVGLVDTAKLLKRGGKAEQGSLAEELTAANPIVQARINHLMGRVMKADSEKELSLHAAAITKSCMVYKGFVARQLEAQRYRTPYIGSRAIPKLLEIKRNELNVLEDRLEEVRKEETLFSEWVKRLRGRSEQLTRIANNLELPSVILEVKNRIKSIDEQISQLDLDKVKQLEENIQLQQSLISDLEEQIKQKQEQAIGFRLKIESEITQLSAAKSIAQEKSALLEEWVHDATAESIKGAETRFREITRTSDLITETLQNVERNQKQNKTMRDNSFVRLLEARRNYNMKYGFNGDSSAESNEEFDGLLIKLDINMEEYQRKNDEALKSAEIEFKSSFIYRMREIINSARLTFRQLNHALAQVPFNKETYRFEVTASSKHKRFYDLIMNHEILEKGTLFDFTGEEHDVDLQELFERLIKGDLAAEEEYADYREYLDFEILITNEESNSKIRFSKVLREKSGGETQTPFYIAILSAFNQLYQSGKTMRLIVFDEAFNKMDQDRILASLQLIKELNLQLIAAVPDEKLAVMMEEVPAAVIVIRNGYRCITNFIGKDEWDDDNREGGKETRETDFATIIGET